MKNYYKNNKDRIRYVEILLDKKNWGSIITLLIAIFAAVINFIGDDPSFSSKTNNLILALIAFEFFLLTVGVFEDMQKDLDLLLKKEDKNALMFEKIQKDIHSLSQEKDSILWSGDYLQEGHKMLMEAEHDFTVIGGSLSYLHNEIQDILDRSQDIEIRLLALDVDNSTVLQQYNNLIHRSTNTTSLSHLEVFTGKDNIEVRKTNSLPLLYFAASDLDLPGGKIIAIHLLPNGTTKQYPCITLTQKDAWYDIYKSQIKSLWDNVVLRESIS